MNDILSDNGQKLKVLVTGFDAFKQIDSINTSGEAVKLIKKKKEMIEESCGIDLVAEVLPVQYRFIDEYVPQLWKKVQPHLSIHVGVSDIAKGLTLEKMAEKRTYIYDDDQAFHPHHGQNPCAGSSRLATDLTVEKICNEFNHGLPEGSLKADISCDAGKYVCEYIYYTSMALYEQMNKRKASLFVHVPLKTKEEDIKEISKQLERILKICVKHIKTTHKHVYLLKNNNKD